MTIHIGAKKSDIAGTVLMPGDPLRAKWAANKFLSNVTEVNTVRGMFGYTGSWKKNKVTIHGSGMGMPSLSIYVNELIRDYNAKTLIRIGSAGGMQKTVSLRDIVIAMTATSVSTPSSTIFKELNFAPCADFGLLKNATMVAESKKRKTHVGGIYSSDTFYDERSDLNKELTRHGILAVEMETAELYNLALRYKRRALSILTISDHLQTGKALSSQDRESSLSDMVEIALEAAFL